MAVDKDKLQEPPLTRFYKTILGWDYLRLLKESKRDKKEIGDGAALGISQVKDRYKDVDDYLATFEPLLFEEVKAQIVQQKDNEGGLDWKVGVARECNESEGFHLTQVIYVDNKDEQISQNDLLLISKKKFTEGAELPTTYAFALVEHRQKQVLDRDSQATKDEHLQDKQNKEHINGQESGYVLRLRMYLGGEVMQINKDAVRSSPRLLNMLPLITPQVSEGEKMLFILKICSLSTIAREYIALRSISSLPFKDLIVTASEKNTGSDDQAWKISRSLTEYIKNNLNESQQEAIQAGLSRKGFVLIQGPPGTGKTQTILGLLSVILHATPARVHSQGHLREIKCGPELPIQEKYNHWAKASPWLAGINPRDQVMPTDGDDGFFPTTGNELKPEVVNSRRKYRVRVLVCAPSNSALDEIVFRLLNTGVRDENDRAYNPKVVRIGLKPHHSVGAVSMDNLVNQKAAVRSATDKQKHGAAGRDPDSIRSAILDEAVIVFSTLSFSGSTYFSKLNRGFDVVIIDEAAQAVEPATLIPLANGCKQVFLIGDPVQLPATVISPVAEHFGYGTSLFKRFQSAGYPVVMLKTQYRMHPEIRRFPSGEFYAEALEDGPDVEDRTKRDWHEYRCFGPFCFFDIEEGKESEPSGSGSWVNVDEIEFILQMYHKLVGKYEGLKSSSQLAIISPYSYQVKLFKEQFWETFGMDKDQVEELVDIGTIDGFQGREKDVAIFSCVRSNKEGRIGFVSDFRRMNVGITRARSSILVVGSASTLRKNEHWKNLVESAEKRDCLFKVTKPYSSFFSNENLMSMKANEEKWAEEAKTYVEMDVDTAIYNNPGDADLGQAEDHDYGDGDGEVDMDAGGFDE